MPRVTVVKKARKSPGSCGRCGKKIERGDPYKWLKKRYGPRKVRCENCAFRASDHAGGRIADVYASQESAEDSLAAWDGEDADALRSILSDLRDELTEHADEYRGSAENIRESFSESSTADECDEKADEIESWVSEIEDAENEIEDFEEEDDDTIPDECEECGSPLSQCEEEGKPIKHWDCSEGCGYEYEPEAVEDGRREEWAEQARARAEEVIGSCPI